MTNREVLLLGVIAAIIAVGLTTRQKPLVPQPRIVTQYDTVRVLDTTWVTRLKHDTVYTVKTNIVERVVTTPPETVFVVPALSALTAISVAPKRGDSTLLLGVSITPLDGTYVMTHWERQFWTPGPLRSVRMIGPTPAVQFDDPPPTCSLKCKAEWATGAVLFVQLLRTVFGHP